MKKRLIIMALALGASAFIFAQDKPTTTPTKKAPTKSVSKHTPNAVSDAKTVKADNKMEKHTPNAVSNEKPNTTVKSNGKVDKKHLPNATSNDKPTSVDKTQGKAVKKNMPDGMQKKKAAETK